MQAFENRGADSSRGGLLAWMLLAVCLLMATPGAALAQEEAGGPVAEESAVERMNYLEWAYNSLGLGYSAIFLMLSFVLLSLIVMNIAKSSRASLAPPDLIDAFEAHLGAKQFSEAYELASGDESMLGKVLAAGLGKLSSGGDYPQAIEAMQEIGEEENLKIENRLSHMALIGTISPMIGLMGTVQGMIASFNEIATSPTTPKPSALAEGISTALFTTLIGLAIAIPAIVAYNLLRNRVAQLVLETGVVSEGLMSRFRNQGAKA